jgi:hypothetical protein
MVNAPGFVGCTNSFVALSKPLLLIGPWIHFPCYKLLSTGGSSSVSSRFWQVSILFFHSFLCLEKHRPNLRQHGAVEK